MDCDQSKLKDIVKSALDELLETKLASLLDKKLEPLHASMNFINKEFEDMKKKISALEERNSDLVKENNFLKQESSRMANKMNQMKTAFDDQDQYIRRDCLEIRGIPVSAQEDTNELIIKAVGSIVDIPVEDNDISISHRMKSGNTIPPIIVKFTRRCVRDAFYKARSRLKD